MAKLKDNPEILKEYGIIILDLKRALKFAPKLQEFDCAYPVKSATSLHLRLLGRHGIDEKLEARFAALMCKTELDWVREAIPPIAQYPMRVLELTGKKGS